MIDLTINGQNVAVLNGESILQEAHKKGIEILTTCAQCSSGCALIFESQKNTPEGTEEGCVFRLKQNSGYPIECNAGKFGFNFIHQSEKNPSELQKACKAFENAKAIRFNSIITNEEAMILQNLKETRDVKLFNDEARAYQLFMKAYASMSGKRSFGGSLDAIAQSDAVIVIGSRIASDNPAIRFAIENAVQRNKADVIYMHPIEDASLQNSITQFVKYEVGTEEGVLAMLAKILLQNAEHDEEVAGFFEELDEGYLCAESNVGDDEYGQIEEIVTRAECKTLVIGSDLLNHKRAENIARLAGLIEAQTEFSVVVVAPSVNTVGVSLICDLDKDEALQGVIGYNAQGDYTVGSMGKTDLPLPAFHQQQGTVVTLNHQVVPTNVAEVFGGYDLSDIADAIGVKTENTGAYTMKLPVSKGFKVISAVEAESFFAPMDEEKRGYTLENIDVVADGKLEEVEDLPEFNGTVVYRCNPAGQFNGYTAMAQQLERNEALRGSAQFATAAKIADGDLVEIKMGTGEQKRQFILDKELKGTIALIPFYDSEYGSMDGRYRFEKAKITRIGS